MANKIEFKIFADIKEFNSAFAGINQTAKNINRTAGVAFLGLGAAIAGVTALAKEQEKVLNQTRAVIKSTGNVAGVTTEQISNLGKELQKVTTFGDEVIISATNILLTFKQIGGDTLPRATKAVLDMSVAMNQGLKESSIQLGKALNDPILGITAMRRVGIQFTKEQEKMIKALVETNQLAKAQDLILEELESQFGGSAEAAREGLGSIDGLKNSLSDLGEVVGTSIAPLISKLARNIQELSDAAQENEGLVKLIGYFLLLATTITGVIFLISGLVTAITTIGGIAAGAIALLVSAGAGIFYVFGNIKEKSDELNEALNGDTGALTQAKTNAEVLTGILKGVEGGIDTLKDKSFLLGTALMSGFGAGTGVDLGTINVSKGSGSSEPPPFIQGFNAGLKEVGENLLTLTDLGKKMALTMQSAMSNAFSDIILGVKTVKEAFKDFGNAILKVVVDYIAEWLAFQILSKALATAGLVFTQTIATATALAWAPAAALASLATLGGNAAPAQAGILSTVATAFSSALPKFATGSGGMKDDTLGMFNKGEIVVPNSFSDAIRSGDLALSGGGSGASNGVSFDFTGATFNGITEEFVSEIFTKAGEKIQNRTLAPLPV